MYQANHNKAQTPSNGEDALEVVRQLMQSGIDVIVLDSIAGLVPTTVVEEEFSYNQMELVGPKGKVLLDTNGRLFWWGI